MEIREATRDDLIHFLRLAREFADATSEPLERESLCRHVEWVIDEENAIALIAMDGENPLGICGGFLGPVFWDDSKLQAVELWWWVTPAARKGGVGLALMDALESWAKEAGAWRLSMMTIDGPGVDVGKIYEHRGFRKYESTYLKEL